MTEIEQEFLESGGEWEKEFLLRDLFNVERGTRLTKEDRQSGDYPLVTAGEFNQGVKEYIGNAEQKIFKNAITIDMFGNSFVHLKPFCCDDNILVLTPKKTMPQEAYFFISTIISMIKNKFGYGKQYRLNSFYDHSIILPTQNDELAFSFMENFIAELKALRVAELKALRVAELKALRVAELKALRVAELKALRVAELHAYLQAAGLSNYTLSDDELAVIEQFNNGKMVFKAFEYQAVFDRIQQGRRLKKDDQIAGDIPFVMSGVTNTGVVNYISNPIAVFPKNSITMDIFGNAFYRSYDYGMGDDTGAYWDSKKRYTKEMLLYLTTAMNKSVEGKFSYGHKLRSSQSLNIQMLLPMKNNQPDLEFMETFISAIQKLVITDVVDWADKEIATTESVI